MVRLLFLVSFFFVVSCKSPSTTVCKSEQSIFYPTLKWSTETKPLISAHRGGGDYNGFPENCLESFEYILKHTPALIECDVRQTADGVLVLMHDESLDRTTTGTGKVRSKSWKYISELKLKDNQGQLTEYKVPSLDQTLDWVRKKGVLTLDIKRGVDFEKVIKMVNAKKVRDNCVIITYDIKDAVKVYNLDPCIMISVNARNFEEWKKVISSGIPFQNLMAFTGTIESSPDLYKAIHEKGVLTMLGTLGNLDRRAESRGDHLYLEFIRKGIDVLATDRPIEVAEVLRSN